eukprot:3292876-Pyramimonas_sp.AAC.1
MARRDPPQSGDGRAGPEARSEPRGPAMALGDSSAAPSFAAQANSGHFAARGGGGQSARQRGRRWQGPLLQAKRSEPVCGPSGDGHARVA